MEFNTTKRTRKDASEFCGRHGMQLPIDFNIHDMIKIREKYISSEGVKAIHVWTGVQRKEFPDIRNEEGHTIDTTTIIQGNDGQGQSTDNICLNYERDKFRRVSCFQVLDGFLCQLPECARCYKGICAYDKQQDTCYRLGHGKLNWYQARKECKLLNGSLWNPKDSSKVTEHFPSIESVWIDGSNNEWKYYNRNQDIFNETDYNIDPESDGDCLTFRLADTVKGSLIRSQCDNNHATLCTYLTQNNEIRYNLGTTEEHSVTEGRNEGPNARYHGFFGCDKALQFVYYGLAAIATANLFICCICLWCQVRRAKEKRKRKSRAKLPSVKELTSRRNRKSNSHKLDDTAERHDLATINMPRYFKNVSADFRKLSTEHKTFSGEKRLSKLIAQGYRNSKSLTILSAESNEFYEVPVDHRTYPLRMSRVEKKNSDDTPADGAIAKKLSAFFEGSMLGGAVSLPQMSISFSDDYNEPLDTLMPPPPLSLYVSEDEEVNQKDRVCKPTDPLDTAL